MPEITRESMAAAFDRLRDYSGEPRFSIDRFVERTHGPISTPVPMLQYFQAWEKAKARLAAVCELTGTPQARVDEMLAEEAEHECGIPTNISAAAMELVADRLASRVTMLRRARASVEYFDCLTTLHISRPEAGQRKRAYEMFEQLKAVARESGIRVEYGRHTSGLGDGGRSEIDAISGRARMFLLDDVCVAERPPGKTVHVAKHREGPGRVGFRISLDTLLAIAEEPVR